MIDFFVMRVFYNPASARFGLCQVKYEFFFKNNLKPLKSEKLYDNMFYNDVRNT